MASALVPIVLLVLLPALGAQDAQEPRLDWSHSFLRFTIAQSAIVTTQLQPLAFEPTICVSVGGEHRTPGASVWEHWVASAGHATAPYRLELPRDAPAGVWRELPYSAEHRLTYDMLLHGADAGVRIEAWVRARGSDPATSVEPLIPVTARNTSAIERDQLRRLCPSAQDEQPVLTFQIALRELRTRLAESAADGPTTLVWLPLPGPVDDAWPCVVRMSNGGLVTFGILVEAFLARRAPVAELARIPPPSESLLSHVGSDCSLALVRVHSVERELWLTGRGRTGWERGEVLQGESASVYWLAGPGILWGDWEREIRSTRKYEILNVPDRDGPPVALGQLEPGGLAWLVLCQAKGGSVSIVEGQIVRDK